MSDVEPTAEDYEAARRELERDPTEIFLRVEAKHQMRLRLAGERAKRRRALLSKLLPFRRAA